MPRDATASYPAPVLDDATLYLGDNGQCFCGACAGQSARYTGRDLSGQEVLPLVGPALSEARAMGWEPRCETCRKVSI